MLVLWEVSYGARREYLTHPARLDPDSTLQPQKVGAVVASVHANGATAAEMLPLTLSNPSPLPLSTLREMGWD